jgi:hypothetical protein
MKKLKPRISAKTAKIFIQEIIIPYLKIFIIFFILGFLVGFLINVL